MLMNKAVKPFFNRHISLMLISSCNMRLMNILTMSKVPSGLGNPAFFKGHVTLNDVTSRIVTIDFIYQGSYAINHIHMLAVIGF